MNLKRNKSPKIEEEVDLISVRPTIINEQNGKGEKEKKDISKKMNLSAAAAAGMIVKLPTAMKTGSAMKSARENSPETRGC